MVSVVTYTYNDHSFVVGLLESLKPLEKIIREVVVVDDASDTLLEIQDEVFNDRIRMIRHESNQGPALAKQSGLNAATSAYMLSIDCDIRFTKTWFLTALERLEDKRVALIGAKIINKDYGDIFSRALHYKGISEDIDVETMFAPGGIWLIKKTMFIQLGGLQDYFQKTHEDYYFSRKVVENGYLIIINQISNALQIRKVRRSTYLKREMQYFLNCYRSIFKNNDIELLLKIMTNEMNSTRNVANKYECDILVYIVIAKFLMVSLNLYCGEGAESIREEIVQSFCVVFRKCDNFIEAISKDCRLKVPPRGLSLASGGLLFYTFEHMYNFFGEERILMIDKTVLPKCFAEEDSIEFDFHYMDTRLGGG